MAIIFHSVPNPMTDCENVSPKYGVLAHDIDGDARLTPADIGADELPR